MGNFSLALVRARSAVELATLLVTSAWANGVVALLLRSAVEAATPPIIVVSVLLTASRLVTAIASADGSFSPEGVENSTPDGLLALQCCPPTWDDQPRVRSRRLIPTRMRRKGAWDSAMIFMINFRVSGYLHYAMFVKLSVSLSFYCGSTRVKYDGGKLVIFLIPFCFHPDDITVVMPPRTRSCDVTAH